jgi:hypothetical protein
MLTSKQKYREFCREQVGMPIFSRDWWLDAVCGAAEWNVLLVERGGRVVASLPYFMIKKWIFNIITTPGLTQVMGPWISYPEGQKYNTRLSFEKEVLVELIERLPKFHKFSQNFHYSFLNWLPFYWKGFSQTTRYTYVIEDLSDTGKVFDDFRENIKTDARKAQRSLDVCVEENVKKFYDINRLIYKGQGMKVPYSFNHIKKVDEACRERGCRKIFFAKDKNGNIHAAIYIIWDENSAYYLAGGTNPCFKGSGAASLLVWEGIKFASTVTERFDFEGSVIMSKEKFFRAFGGIQRPYFHITKVNSMPLKIINFIRGLGR